MSRQELEECLSERLVLFADKERTQRAITKLQKELKDTLAHLGHLQKMTLANEDESMLTKKHLCGLSCATCDKNLTDI